MGGSVRVGGLGAPGIAGAAGIAGAPGTEGAGGIPGVATLAAGFNVNVFCATGSVITATPEGCSTRVRDCASLRKLDDVDTLPVGHFVTVSRSA
jgi:hypothetical protein